MKRVVIILISIVVVLLACKTKSQTTELESNEGRRMDNFTYLYMCMQGDFSSELQSKNDSGYYDIRLRMVPVWEKNNDAFYLYVEQAMSTALDKPYRQRFYKVVKTDDTHFVSYIYQVSSPARFTGKLQGDAVFSSITPDSLTIKDGCEVSLTYDAASWTFSGSTGEKSCPSERSGAAYATAKVKLTESQMESWDQGWSSEGKQVWGAIKGGYVFVKQ